MSNTKRKFHFYYDGELSQALNKSQYSLKQKAETQQFLNDVLCEQDDDFHNDYRVSENGKIVGSSEEEYTAEEIAVILEAYRTRLKADNEPTLLVIIIFILSTLEYLFGPVEVPDHPDKSSFLLFLLAIALFAWMRYAAWRRFNLVYRLVRNVVFFRYLDRTKRDKPHK